MSGVKVDRPRTQTEACTLYRRAKRWSDDTEFRADARRALEEMLRDAGWIKSSDWLGESWGHGRINGYWSFHRAVAMTAFALAGDEAMPVWVDVARTVRRWGMSIDEPLCAPLPQVGGES